MVTRSNSIATRAIPTTLATTSATDRRFQCAADIVVIGNGIAGLTAALEARRLAPEKSIAIISDQCHPTLHTPALKHFAIGKLEREQLLAYPAGTERDRNIQIVQARVESIEAQHRYVKLTYGGCIGYDALLIATGSVANGLPAHLPGKDFDGVLTLHRLHHYIDLRRRLNEVDDVVVIGSGIHAVETITNLLQLGIQTHWLMRGKTCLSRVLDQRASERVIQHMQRAGAKVYKETEVLGIAGNVGVVAGVLTNRHQLLPCQLVLVCTGSTPATLLAQRCTTPLLYEQARGIFVNDLLRTSIQDIYAAGDVAAIRNPLTGVHEVRAQWHSAVVQGYIAAAAMTGQNEASMPTFGVPWHATRAGEISLLTVGDPLGCLEGAVTLTDSSKGGYRRLSLVDDRLVGYLSLGPLQADGLAIKRLIDEGYSIRAVKDALLKGTFDACAFFTQQHSFAVLAIATSGHVPVVKARHPITAPLVAQTSRASFVSMLVSLPSSTQGTPSSGLLSNERQKCSK